MRSDRTVSAVRRIICTAVFCAVSVCSLAQTAWAQERIYYRGDADLNGTVDSADAAKLCSALTSDAALQDQTAAVCADLNNDGRINAVDLTILKRRILTNADPEPVSSADLPVPGLIPSPLSAIHPSLPSTGNVRILTLLISFPDCAQQDIDTPEQVQSLGFGPEDTGTLCYPMESISAFYQRASYGRLHLTSDVISYTAELEIAYYIGKADKLMEEAFTALDDQIDFTRYDANGDSILDACILSVPYTADKTKWRARTGPYNGSKIYDGIKPGYRCYGCSGMKDRTEFNGKWSHELGHAMGLPDYYKYFNTENGYYGMYGDAGWEIMDDAECDFSSFSKLMLGWLTESEVQIYTGGTQTFTLASAQNEPGCVLIPRTDLNGYLSEYFILEYQTTDGNNYAFFDNLHIYHPFREGGLRVLHCEATVCEGIRGPELKWNNYGRYYDSSNTKQRVLRLANEEEGGTFFRAGDSVTDSISGFHWYDDDGMQTVSPGCKITVQSIADGICTLTVSE